MTIGARIMTLLIRVVGQACLAATITPAVSTTVETEATGGRPQSPIPTHGYVHWPTVTIISTEVALIATTGSLLAASGIRYLNLSDAVALC